MQMSSKNANNSSPSTDSVGIHSTHKGQQRLERRNLLQLLQNGTSEQVVVCSDHQWREEWRAGIFCDTSDCMTHARVDNTHWNGAHAASTSFLNCFATDLATNLRNVVPVAIPHTPPSFSSKAVSVAIVKQCIAFRGTLPHAKSAAVKINN